MRYFSIFFVLFFIGCSPSTRLSGLVPAEGVVLHNGSPVSGATVSFIPLGETRSAVAVTDANGRFKMMTLHPADGIMAGGYVITLSKTEEIGGGKRDEDSAAEPLIVQHLPVKYAERETTNLRITVSAKGDRNIRLELTGEADTTPKNPVRCGVLHLASVLRFCSQSFSHFPQSPLFLLRQTHYCSRHSRQKRPNLPQCRTPKNVFVVRFPLFHAEKINGNCSGVFLLFVFT
ncbi:MAG: DUF4198 domain-containing protein [Planctomycetaceae bacterium]|jgi:hypothetical protein|nr:DUF4198 domain-containing protein [Planctomycetaceae bacterium]